MLIFTIRKKKKNKSNKVKVGEVSVERANPKDPCQLSEFETWALFQCIKMKPPLCIVLVRSGIAYVKNKSSKNC